MSVGAVVSPALASVASLLPFDASFTGRNEVWRFAFASIAQKPFFGYGYFAFWGSDYVKEIDTGEAIDNWVLIASHSHNGYLDSALALGIPGLLLVISILVIIPLRNYHRAAAYGAPTPLANMFLRVWLFGILHRIAGKLFPRSHRSDVVHLPGGGDRPALFVAVSNHDIARGASDAAERVRGSALADALSEPYRP